MVFKNEIIIFLSKNKKTKKLIIDFTEEEIFNDIKSKNFEPLFNLISHYLKIEIDDIQWIYAGKKSNLLVEISLS